MKTKSYTTSEKLSAIKSRRIVLSLCITAMVITVLAIFKILLPSDGKPDAIQSYIMLALMAILVIFYFIAKKQSKLLAELKEM